MKGISQVVSAVVILAVSVSLVSIYAEWAPTFTEDIVGKVADQTDREIKCDNAAISIDDAEYSRSAKRVFFDLRNTGTIRLSGGLNAGAFNSSIVTNRTTISSLEVDETREITIISTKIPDEILVSSKDCPEIEVSEERITIS